MSVEDPFSSVQNLSPRKTRPNSLATSSFYASAYLTLI